MAGFGKQSVKKLDYDFGGIPHRDESGNTLSGRGVIPEPGDERLERFQRRLLEIIRDAADDAEAGESAAEPGALGDMKEQVERALRELDSGRSDRADFVPMLADLCNGSPSEELIDALPQRYLSRYFAYVVDGFSPEASGAATTP